MRKEAVKVTPGAIIPPGAKPAPKRAPKPAQRAQPGEASPATAGQRSKAPKARTAGTRSSRAASPAPSAPPPAPAREAASAAAGGGRGATRRHFFRLDVFDVHVTFSLEALGDQAAPPARVQGRLRDVSGGGLRLVAASGAGPLPDWPVGAGVRGRLQFTLLPGQPAFNLPGRLVRRVETGSGYELAFSWDDPPQAEIDRLVHSLHQLEVRRWAATPEAEVGAARPTDPAGTGPRARARPPLLLGASLGLAVADAVCASLPVTLTAAVLGIAAVACAAAYLLAGSRWRARSSADAGRPDPGRRTP